MRRPKTINDLQEKWIEAGLNCSCHWKHYNQLQELGILWVIYNIEKYNFDNKDLMHIFGITKEDVRAYYELQNM